MKHLINKKTIQKIMTLLLVVFLSCSTMSTKVLAEAAVSSDPGKGTANNSSGQNSGSIKNAEEAGVKQSDILQAIKDALGLSEEDAIKVYNSCYDDTTKITVNYTVVASGAAAGNVSFSSIQSNLTQDDIATIKDGSYNSNPASQQGTAGGGGIDTGASSKEEDDDGLGGVLAFPIAALLNAIGDTVNYILQSMLIGNNDAAWPVIRGSEAVTYMETTKVAPGSSPEDANLPVIYIKRSAMESLFGTYDVAQIKMTPAEIFSGNVAALNANFFENSTNYDNKLGGADKSIVEDLKNTISGWYVAIRNIAIVGLLSVLIYLGIRMIISSSVGDKAKYKQMFLDWIVALCLIFFLHYIMAFTMTISETVTDMLAGSSSADGTINQVIIQLTTDSEHQNLISNRRFYSNFVNVVRMKSQFPNLSAKLGYTILYLALTFFTAYFAVVYLKRLIMLAFLTMIAPFVSLTYPLDKVKDGHAQAFNFWLKEYIFYALLQPLHMLLYTVFVSSALSIAANNMIYAIVAIAFIMPAEKIVKQMFGIKGNTESNISGFAGGAVASTVLGALRKPPKSPKTSGGGNGGQSKPRIAKNPNGGGEMDSIMSGSAPSEKAGNLPSGSNEGAEAPQVANTEVGKNETQHTMETQGDTVQTSRTGNESFETSNATVESGMPTQAGITEETTTTPRPTLEGNSPTSGLSGRFANMLNRQQSGELRKRQLLNSVKNSNLGRAVGRRYKMAGGAGGIAKSLAKGAIKAYARGATTAAVTLAGAAMGMVDGPEGMLKGAALGGSVGLVAGKNLTTGAGNFINNTLSGNNALGSFASEVRYGSYEEALKKSGEKAYISDKNNIDRIAQDNPELSAQKIKEYASREYNMLYDSKTDNVEYADKALELEDSYIQQGMSEEDAHTRARGVLNATKNYDKSMLSDRKKRINAKQDLMDRIMAQQPSMSKEEAEQRTDRHLMDIASIYKMNLTKNMLKLPENKESTNTVTRRTNSNNITTRNNAQTGGQTTTQRVNTSLSGRSSRRTTDNQNRQAPQQINNQSQTRTIRTTRTTRRGRRPKNQ